MDFAWNYFSYLAWFAYIFCSGVHLFSKGFLLTRVAQTDHNTCHNFNSYQCRSEEVACDGGDKINEMLMNVNQSASVCLPKKSKIILLVIDALKYEFGVYNPDLSQPLPYQNKLPIINEMLTAYPDSSRLLKFMADPPTTTLQRLKALTTGSLPTFIDIGSNFATPEITEDSIIDQFNAHNLTSIFMGDNTWTELFPARFKRKYAYPSFNIYDLDTIDNEINRILPTELANTDWDILIGHYLGVDHCGHRYGPNHREMGRKLAEMDSVIRNVIEKMDHDTTLFVLGDHGMTADGDHGGETLEETTALFFGYSKGHSFVPNTYSSDREEMQQIDLVPTLAAILGVPVPYSNLGITQLNLLPDVPIDGFSRYQIMLMHMWQNARQMHTYFRNYAHQNKGTFKDDELEDIDHKFLVLTHRVNSIYTEVAFLNFVKDLRAHLDEILTTCRSIWIKFDTQLMTHGLLITAFVIMFSFILINNFKAGQLEKVFHKDLLLFIYGTNGIVGCIAYMLHNIIPMGNEIHSVLFATSIYSCGILLFLIVQYWPHIALNWNQNQSTQSSSIITRIIYGFCVSVFFSNSYIVEEQKVLCYMLICMMFMYLFHLRKRANSMRPGTILRSVLFRLLCVVIIGAVLLRVSWTFFRCREEQGNCTQFTEAGGDLESAATSKPRRRQIDIVPVVALALFATTARLYLRTCGNLAGFSPHVVLSRYGPTIAVICTGGHFILSQSLPQKLRQIHVDALAWVVYALFAIQLIMLLVSPLLLYIIPQQQNSLSVYGYDRVVPELYRQLKRKFDVTNEDPDEDNIPIVCGLATVYSSIYISFGAFFAILLALLLGLNASTGIFLICFVSVVLIVLGATLQCESPNSFELCLQPRFITLTSWLLLSHYCFYATSHQPTMSQIDWRAAFVGRSAMYDNSNILSGILVVLSTFGGSFLFMMLYPLLAISPFIVHNSLPSLVSHTRSRSDLKATTIGKADDTSGGMQNDDAILKFDFRRGELSLYENEVIFFGSIFKIGCQFFMLQGLRIFFAMLGCTVHSRHLMVWKIFAPRFIYEGIATYVTIASIMIGYLILIRVHASVNALIVKLSKSL